MKINLQTGFTLIELLVVISIISLLSSIVLTSLVEVRERARETQLIAQFVQVRDAIQRYENDTGELPFSDGSSHANWNAMMGNLVPEYLSEALGFDAMREVFGMRTGDPRIGTANTFYCEGDSNPSRYIAQFKDEVGGDRFVNDLPRLMYSSGDSPFANFYCMFTPIR